MTHIQFAIKESNIPRELTQSETDTLLNSIPSSLWAKVNTSVLNEAKVIAYSNITTWINNNWKKVLPNIKESTITENKNSVNKNLLNERLLGLAGIRPLKPVIFLSDRDQMNSEFSELNMSMEKHSTIYESKYGVRKIPLSEVKNGDYFFIDPSDKTSSNMYVKINEGLASHGNVWSMGKGKLNISDIKDVYIDIND